MSLMRNSDFYIYKIVSPLIFEKGLDILIGIKFQLQSGLKGPIFRKVI